MRSPQRGMSILFVALVLIAVAAGALAFLVLTRTAGGVDRSTETSAHLAKVADALERFASTQERLPCPANPALDTGDAEPNAGSAACAHATGTVPWRTIGLRREDSLDAWGSKLSYRVYSGATGLTQSGGASMVNCDTIEPTPAGVSATGLCRGTRDTTVAQFIAGKGLSVNDFGTPYTDAAYVVVSHGPTGQGAYTTSGTAKPPNPGSADELANLAAAGPFVAKAAVTNVASTAATFFDDILVYRRLPDFVRRANLAAREWPEATPPAFADLTFNQATVSAAVGAPVTSGASTGTSTLNFANATVTAFNSGGNQNISFETVGGTEGIGGVGGGNLISSTSGEGVRIDLTQGARRFAMTFMDFGRLTGTPGNPREQVDVTFFNGATQVATFTKQGCKPDGDFASFSIDAGVDFNRVDVKAIGASDGTSPTNFLFVQLKSCDAVTICETALSTPGNSCP